MVISSQPVIYVGVGGTGVRAGQALQKLLPAWSNDTQSGIRYPCLVVNIDFDAEIDSLMAGSGLPEATVNISLDTCGAYGPRADHRAFQDLCLRMRLEVDPQAIGWLPDYGGPFPAVARAILWHELLRFGQLRPKLRGVVERIHSPSLQHQQLDPTDTSHPLVLLGFSVAGGTGSGLFADVIMLLTETFRDLGVLEPMPYLIPIVALPQSPFADERHHQLNAGSSIADLLQLARQAISPRAGVWPVGDPGVPFMPTHLTYPRAIERAGAEGIAHAAMSLLSRGPIHPMPGQNEEAILGRPHTDADWLDANPKANSCLELWLDAKGQARPDDRLSLRERFVTE